MSVYAWKIFFENAIEMVLINPSNRASEGQTFRNHHHLASSHRTQWKHLVFISERVSCIHVWRTLFSVVPIHRTVQHKNESYTDSTSLSRKIQMCSCVKCTRVSGNFSLMLSIFDGWMSYFWKISQCNTTFDLKINLGHSDLYLTVQWIFASFDFCFQKHFSFIDMAWFRWATLSCCNIFIHELSQSVYEPAHEIMVLIT